MFRSHWFTEAAGEVLTGAEIFAMKLGHLDVATHHVLFSFVKMPTLGGEVLQELGATTHILRQAILRITPIGSGRILLGKMPVSDEAMRMAHLAVELAQTENCDKANPVHLFLAILRLPSCLAHSVLAEIGIDRNTVLDRFLGRLNSSVGPE